MNRRLIGLVLAVLMAAAGTFVLVSYVRGAEERAIAGEESVEVLVVDRPIVKGTAASKIGPNVKRILVPAKVQAPGSIADLADLGEKVAAVDLLPGDQVVTGRFVEAKELAAASRIQVPESLLQVTLSLSPERAVGGQLTPGATVGVFASFDPFTGTGFDPSLDDGLPGTTTSPQTRIQTPNSTHLILHKILVTNVQVERLPKEDALESSADQGLELAPTGNLLVTLAVEADAAERIIFAAEHGAVWLANEPLEAYEFGTQIQTRETIYQ